MGASQAPPPPREPGGEGGVLALSVHHFAQHLSPPLARQAGGGGEGKQGSAL